MPAWAPEQSVYYFGHLRRAALYVAPRMLIQPTRPPTAIDKHHLRRRALRLQIGEVLADGEDLAAVARVHRPVGQRVRLVHAVDPPLDSRRIQTIKDRRLRPSAAWRTVIINVPKRRRGKHVHAIRNRPRQHRRKVAVARPKLERKLVVVGQVRPVVVAHRAPTTRVDAR